MKLKVLPEHSLPMGWLIPVMDAGIRCGYRPGRLGRTHWLFKAQGEHVKLTQDKHRAMASSVEIATPAQQKILETLSAAGIVRTA